MDKEQFMGLTIGLWVRKVIIYHKMPVYSIFIFWPWDGRTYLLLKAVNMTDVNFGVGSSVPSKMYEVGFEERMRAIGVETGAS